MTALLALLPGLLSGLLTGALPELIKEWRDRGASTREREFLKLQHTWELERLKVGADMKMREAESAIVAEEIRATRETLTAIVEGSMRPTGFAWIDGFNALLRPTVSMGVSLLFFWVAVVYINAVLQKYFAGNMDAMQLYAAIFRDTIIAETILSVWGFLFGYRGYRKFGNS